MAYRLVHAFPSAPVFPNAGSITDSINEFKPDLKIGYVESFTFGIQREMNSNNVIEFAGLATGAIGSGGNTISTKSTCSRTASCNEFRLAQQNVLANLAAGRGLNFRYLVQAPARRPCRSFTHISGCARANAGNCNSGRNLHGLQRGAVFKPPFANTTLLGFLNPLNPNTGGG